MYAQRRHHETKIEYWKGQGKTVSENMKKHIDQLDAVNRKLGKMIGREIMITTHFLQRWYKRVDLTDNEQSVRQKVLTEQFTNMVRTLGGKGEFPWDKYMIIVDDYKLLTITYPHSKEERRKQQNRNRKRYG